jgi:hypothetical protein
MHKRHTLLLYKKSTREDTKCFKEQRIIAGYKYLERFKGNTSKQLNADNKIFTGIVTRIYTNTVKNIVRNRGLIPTKLTRDILHLHKFIILEFHTLLH